MKEHIIEILDSNAFDALSENDLSTVRTHSAGCEDCSQAFQAARTSAAVLRFESAQVTEPSPFFQTKVMAAFREQQSQTRSLWDFWRMWQASGSLVTMMVALVVMLVFAGALAPSTRGSDAVAFTDESEAVIFAEDNALGDMANEQVFPVILEK